MGVKLRLARHGQKKRPFYRIVAAETSARRDGRFLEIVGTYNPMTEPATVNLKEEPVRQWLEQGALPTALVRSLIKKNIPGLIEEREDSKKAKVRARREQRKTRTKGSAKREKSPKKLKKAKASA